MKRLLFVCLGNICRSPIAEAVARTEFARVDLDIAVASAGTGNWHVGHGADARAIASAAAQGYDLSAHRARQVEVADFNRFDTLLAMDRANLRELSSRCPAQATARLELLLPFSGLATPAEVPDPYRGDMDDFEHVVLLLRQAVQGLIARSANAT